MFFLLSSSSLWNEDPVPKRNLKIYIAGVAFYLLAHYILFCTPIGKSEKIAAYKKYLYLMFAADVFLAGSTSSLFGVFTEDEPSKPPAPVPAQTCTLPSQQLPALPSQPPKQPIPLTQVPPTSTPVHPQSTPNPVPAPAPTSTPQPSHPEPTSTPQPSHPEPTEVPSSKKPVSQEAMSSEEVLEFPVYVSPRA